MLFPAAHSQTVDVTEPDITPSVSSEYDDFSTATELDVFTLSSIAPVMMTSTLTPTTTQPIISPTQQPPTAGDNIFDFFNNIPTGIIMLVLLSMTSAIILLTTFWLIVTTVCCIVCYRHGKRQSQPKNVFTPSINPYFQESSQSDVPDPIYELEEKDTSKLIITE